MTGLLWRLGRFHCGVIVLSVWEIVVVCGEALLIVALSLEHVALGDGISVFFYFYITHYKT